jgi:RIO-like serine/threonine protein kinase
MTQPFTREEFASKEWPLIYKGQWANAVLSKYNDGSVDWVVKDFGPRSWLIKNTLGRRFQRRELKTLQKLSGIAGIPERVFALDSMALCYVFKPGKTLRSLYPDVGSLDRDYFLKLEEVVKEMHSRGMVHLDLRNGENVLVTDDGAPFLLDFQSSLSLRCVPRCFRAFLRSVDMSGVYKHWDHICPDSMDDERKAALASMNRKRKYWFVKGYFIEETQRVVSNKFKEKRG